MAETQRDDTLRLLVEENQDLLAQGIKLIESISPSLYLTNQNPHFSSGVGKHFRHILDFYDRFLGADAGLIDYDARDRDRRTETDPEYAIDRAREVTSGLDRMESMPDDESVRVRVETRNPDGVGLLTQSSVERELAQLASHTVHHYAIIGMVLSILGVAVPGGFGVAPSTLRHERRLAD